MQKNFLVVGAGKVQLPIIERAKSLGYKVFAIDGDPQAPGFLVADTSCNIDILDINACVSFAQKHKISGVGTLSSDIALPTVAAISASIGIPGPSVRVVERVTNKKLMNECLTANGVPVAKSIPVNSIEDAIIAFEKLGEKVVIKPPDSAGSRGVSFVDNKSKVVWAYKHSKKVSRKNYVLVESFLEGTEVSVEGFVVNGKYHQICISDKLRTNPPFLLDKRVSFPSNQPLNIQESIGAVAKSAVEALCLNNVPFHIELILTPDGPYVVEVAGRGAGFFVFSHILPWVTGVDTIDVLINMSFGNDVDIVCKNMRGAIIHFIESKPGKVVDISDIEKIKNTTGVLDADIYVKPGDIIQPLTSGSERPGHIITFANTREIAENILNKALDDLIIVVI